MSISYKLAAMALAVLMFGAPMLSGAARAEDAGSTEPTADQKAMTELLAKEKAARKACKIEVCSILRGKKAEGPDINCHIVKSWPKEDLSDLIKLTQIEWPWGPAHCTLELSMKREMLVKAMTEPKYEAVFSEHEVACDIERGAGKDNYAIKVKFTPKISFEAGKPTAGSIAWGKAEAPLLAQSVIWPATAADNQLNALGGKIVKGMEDFMTTKCDEVKDELKLD
jgi:hypothetical protein